MFSYKKHCQIHSFWGLFCRYVHTYLDLSSSSDQCPIFEPGDVCRRWTFSWHTLEENSFSLSDCLILGTIENIFQTWNIKFKIATQSSTRFHLELYLLYRIEKICPFILNYILERHVESTHSQIWRMMMMMMIVCKLTQLGWQCQAGEDDQAEVWSHLWETQTHLLLQSSLGGIRTLPYKFIHGDSWYSTQTRWKYLGYCKWLGLKQILHFH